MLGKGGGIFILDLACRGAKFIVPSTTNPSSIDPYAWKDFGIPEEIADEQTKLNKAFSDMGAFLCDTCTPYLVGHVPRMREHVAWNESSAIVFANSVLGARTNREGGPSALAAALTGRVPEYGYHLAQNRHGDLKIHVTARLEQQHHYGTLGFFAGKIAGDKIPVFTGMPGSISWDELKLLGAAAATSGSITLYHIVGITPEAPTEAAAFGEKKPEECPTVEFGENELRETEESLSYSKTKEVSLVAFGCPHASITEIREIARLLSDKKLNSGVELWVSTSSIVKAYADMMGYTGIIEASGAKVTCHICPLTPYEGFLKDLGHRTIATNSPKLATYVDQGQDVSPYYGSMERCIKAAFSGIWR
jgi:predicted aconitase